MAYRRHPPSLPSFPRRWLPMRVPRTRSPWSRVPPGLPAPRALPLRVAPAARLPGPPLAVVPGWSLSRCRFLPGCLCLRLSWLPFFSQSPSYRLWRSTSDRVFRRLGCAGGLGFLRCRGRFRLLDLWFRVLFGGSSLGLLVRFVFLDRCYIRQILFDLFRLGLRSRRFRLILRSRCFACSGLGGFRLRGRRRRCLGCRPRSRLAPSRRCLFCRRLFCRRLGSWGLGGRGLRGRFRSRLAPLRWRFFSRGFWRRGFRCSFRSRLAPLRGWFFSRGFGCRGLRCGFRSGLAALSRRFLCRWREVHCSLLSFRFRRSWRLCRRLAPRSRGASRACPSPQSASPWSGAFSRPLGRGRFRPSRCRPSGLGLGLRVARSRYLLRSLRFLRFGVLSLRSGGGASAAGCFPLVCALRGSALGLGCGGCRAFGITSHATLGLLPFRRCCVLRTFVVPRPVTVRSPAGLSGYCSRCAAPGR